MVSSTSDSGPQEVLDKPENVDLSTTMPEFSLECLLANHLYLPMVCFSHM